MNVDEREFFSEATLRICSSLEIEKAMSLCVQYISQFIPLDTIFLNLYQRDLGSMRTIASATSCGGKRLDRVTYLPEEARASLDEKKRMFRKEGTSTGALIVNHPEVDPICRPMIDNFGIPDTSLLVMPLTLEQDVIGHMIFVVQGKDRYISEHARLVSLLKEPFAIAMSNALKHEEVLKLKELLVDDNRYLQDELQRMRGDEIIGADFGLKRVLDMAQYVAPLDSPVLLLGETGTGKEVIASAIHSASQRRGCPFIRVNCGAIPETLIDSELFGHEKGAFTGALSQKRGRFERAHGGTIFLDEIGELPLNAQVRLLRVLQEKEIERVGGTKSIQVDIRVIAATHRYLEDMITRGTFREDLYFRLKVFPILIPPLRERRGDIPALVHYFMHKKSLEMKLGFIPTLESKALERLMAYDWPGNVRELENSVERALILCQRKPLAFADLDSSSNTPRELRTEQADERLTLNQVMERHIRSVLKITRGKIEGKGGAAESLGLNPGTLRHRMRLLGIPFGRKIKTKGDIRTVPFLADCPAKAGLTSESPIQKYDISGWTLVRGDRGMDDVSDLANVYYERMRANYQGPENLKITPDNVFQEGIRHNYDLLMELIDRLMLQGSTVKGAGNLEETLSLLKEKKSVLFLMKHLGNLDVPCFYALLSREGERYRDILDRLVFIAGRKLSEDSLMVKSFSEIFSRLVIVPRREIPAETADETPDHKEHRRIMEREAARINRAALRSMLKLKKAGRIIVLFPMGGRPKPWLPVRGVKETTGYMRIFDYVHFIKMEGNLLPVGRVMAEERPQRDRIIFTVSRPVLSARFLEETSRLHKEQTQEKDYEQFNVDRVMVEIGQHGGSKDP